MQHFWRSCEIISVSGWYRRWHDQHILHHHNAVHHWGGESGGTPAASQGHPWPGLFPQQWHQHEEEHHGTQLVSCAYNSGGGHSVLGAVMGVTILYTADVGVVWVWFVTHLCIRQKVQQSQCQGHRVTCNSPGARTFS